MVYLYRTCIVTINHDCMRLNSGNFKTVTTKNRMNLAMQTFSLPYRVYQREGLWYVWNYQTKETIDFYDTFVLLPVTSNKTCK